jgi:hypothetical protein
MSAQMMSEIEFKSQRFRQKRKKSQSGLFSFLPQAVGDNLSETGLS